MEKLVGPPRKREEGLNNKRGRFSGPAWKRAIFDEQDQWSVFSIWGVALMMKTSSLPSGLVFTTL
jgi:hypothetical protein